MSVHKTLAHATAADVAAGKTTEWERRGNGHADRLAKLGAAAHGVTQHHLNELAVLASVAYQASKRAGELRVLVQQAEVRLRPLLPPRRAAPSAPGGSAVHQAAAGGAKRWAWRPV